MSVIFKSVAIKNFEYEFFEVHNITTYKKNKRENYNDFFVCLFVLLVNPF